MSLQVGAVPRSTRRMDRRIRGEEECEPEPDEQQVRGERDACNQDRRVVETRAAHEPKRSDGQDHQHADDGVPGLVRQAFQPIAWPR